MPKIQLLTNVTLPSETRALGADLVGVDGGPKGDGVVDVSQEIADRLIRLGAAEKVSARSSQRSED